MVIVLYPNIILINLPDKRYHQRGGGREKGGRSMYVEKNL